MTKRQAWAHIALLVFGVILIPFFVGWFGYPNFAIGIFWICFLTFCYYPTKRRNMNPEN